MPVMTIAAATRMPQAVTTMRNASLRLVRFGFVIGVHPIPREKPGNRALTDP